jgi:hypothetical protein
MTRVDHPLLVAATELLGLLDGMQAQVAAIKSQLERYEVPALTAPIPVLVCDDPTLAAELRERISAIGVACARAYGYGSRSGRPARGGVPQVAARLRAALGIQRIAEMRVAQWSKGIAALRRIEQDARQRIHEMSTDAGEPAKQIEAAPRADVARARDRDAAGPPARADSGRPAPEPGMDPTPPRKEVP